MPAVFTVNAKPVASKLEVDGPLGVSGPTLPEFTAGAPEQSPFRNQSTVTLPVGGGLPPPPSTVTRSCTVEPTGTDVTTACAALWIAVVVVQGSCVTTLAEPA